MNGKIGEIEKIVFLEAEPLYTYLCLSARLSARPKFWKLTSPNLYLGKSIIVLFVCLIFGPVAPPTAVSAVSVFLLFSWSDHPLERENNTDCQTICQTKIQAEVVKPNQQSGYEIVVGQKLVKLVLSCEGLVFSAKDNFYL